MEITTDLIMTLRKRTNAGIMDCKNALKEADCDIDRAGKILREKGILKMQARQDRLSEEGSIYSYIHPGGKVGVMVEIASETDFVAKSDDFTNLLKETALQIAGMKPSYIQKEDVPETVLEEEKKLLLKDLDLSKKPPEMAEKIVEGKLSKFYGSACLLEQPYFRDEKVKFKNYFNGAASSFGEAVKITRFTRYEIGQ
ncbi:MAG: elongation factor Ts [Elusimicrobia bacterium HGW-Elusimicrobia-2]|nr:MAG: elongation factor Ts [Elusimicrobia bacterium HGW-Elusimicrobia-2]